MLFYYYYKVPFSPLLSVWLIRVFIIWQYSIKKLLFIDVLSLEGSFDSNSDSGILRVFNNWPLKPDENPFEVKQIQVAWFLPRSFSLVTASRNIPVSYIPGNDQVSAADVEFLVRPGDSAEISSNIHVIGTGNVADSVCVILRLSWC